METTAEVTTQSRMSPFAFAGIADNGIRQNISINARIATNEFKPKTLAQEIADAFHVPVEYLFIKTRKREIVNARQVYVYLLKNTPVLPIDTYGYVEKKDHYSLNRIGFHVGLDHATVIHCVKAVTNFYDTERWYRQLIDNLQPKLDQRIIALPNVYKRAA